ncbi:MAG: hypothetical protein QOH74_2220, partial [Gaiellales bacterium]|nr:hypothetical protein [Gaiellales bacterium]
VDCDEAISPANERDVGEVVTAYLVHARNDLEDAVSEVSPRQPPEPRRHGRRSSGRRTACRCTAADPANRGLPADRAGRGARARPQDPPHRRGALDSPTHRRSYKGPSSRDFRTWWPSCSTPNGIRTRVAALKGRRPRPLADGGAAAEYASAAAQPPPQAAPAECACRASSSSAWRSSHASCSTRS